MKTIAPIALAVVVAAFAGTPAHAAGFTDVLAQPAVMSPLASRSLMQGVARAGGKLVAVGQRGHIVVSADDGKSWQQARVPVSSDLTAVVFVNERRGWAVGHDGVILASADGGVTWTLQLDGKRANEAVLADLVRKAATQPASKALETLITEAERNVAQGADKPFLDVWFADEKTGYAVGAFNLIFRTDDGGQNWLPWFDRTDNPKFLNLYAIRPAAGQMFIAGEAGLLLRLDPAAERFRAVELSYEGTLFGVTGDAATVLVFGLRGNAYRSGDAGRTWAKIDTGLPASIVAGIALPGDAFVLVDAGGRLVRSDDHGRSFRAVPLPASMMSTAVVDAGGGRIALAGARGVLVTSSTAR